MGPAPQAPPQHQPSEAGAGDQVAKRIEFQLERDRHGTFVFVFRIPIISPQRAEVGAQAVEWERRSRYVVGDLRRHPLNAVLLEWASTSISTWVAPVLPAGGQMSAQQ